MPDRTGGAGRAAILVSLLVLLLAAAGFWLWRSLGVDAGRAVRADGSVLHLDLAEAARFAIHRKGPAGAAPSFVATRVELPAGSAIAWSLRMPVGGYLAASSIDVSEGARAELHAENDVGERRVIALEGCTSRCLVDLSEFSGQIVRLTMRVATDAPGDGPALSLQAPAIRGEPAPELAERPRLEPPPSVFIYLIDTLRADKLGVYGHPGGLTPAIDAFARDATVFELSLAQGNWTKPSVTSIFTGLDARVHRMNTLFGRLPDDAVTMAELLGEAGYATAAVMTNGIVDAAFGYDQGFDRFVRERGRAPDVPGLQGDRADKPAIDSDVAHDAFVRLLDESRLDTPLFMYVHVLDPHAPHFPPEPFKSRFVPELDRFDLGSMESVREMVDMAKRGEHPPERVRRQFEQLYEAEIAHNDLQFGRFIATLRERGLYDDALIVFVSDHGESFWQKGRIGHGRTLEEGLIRVPLVVKTPGQTAGRRLTSMAQHIDLLPTLLDYANAPRPGGLPGDSLRPVLELGDKAREGMPPRLAVIAGVKSTAIRLDRWKLVKRSTRPVALYDVEADPDEERNVADAHRVLTRFMLEEAARTEARATPLQPMSESAQPAVSDEKKAELRALGYLE